MTTEHAVEKKTNILDLFSAEEQADFKEQNDGSLRGPCPQCGRGTGGADPFILTPKEHRAYCFKTARNFNFLELAAMKNKLINCQDGRESGEKGPITGKLFYEVLEMIKDEYGEEALDKVYHDFNIRKPLILAGTGKLISKFAKELAEVIKHKNTLFYRHEAKDIVEISRVKGCEEEMTYTGFLEITPNRFISLIERYIIPKIEVTGKGGIVNIFEKSMNKESASVILSSQEFQESLPQISRIFTIPLPILYKDELTFPNRGYDKRFNSWLPYNAPNITTDNMTLADAKELIDIMLKEFCFKNELARTNAIAALLTPFLRGLFPTFSTRTPVFFYEANRERCGKDYLAGITGILYEGSALEETPISVSEKSSSSSEEIRKKITAAFINGRKRLHFSNNRGHIDNAVFESFTTNSKYSDRPLGKSTMVSFDNEMDVSLSGNIGVTYTADFANRCKFIRLFLDIEDANQRKFENPDLQEWVKTHRGLVLSALYMLVKNWIDNGKPLGQIPFTSFPHWAQVCGGIMEAAGYDNPCSPDPELCVTGDTETLEMKALFELCYANYPERVINKETIRNLISGSGELFGYLDLNTRSDQTKFGIKIIRFTNRVLSGIRLLPRDESVRSSRMEYVFTKKDNFFGRQSTLQQKIETVQDCVKSAEIVETTPKVGHLSYPGHISKQLIGLSSQENRYEKVAKVYHVTKPLNTTDIKKSDRELQFYEAPECEAIKSACTKEQVLDFIIKNKYSANYKIIHNELGLGALKWENELLAEGKIKINELGVYEIL
jgi:hypothetical protein